VTKLVALVLVAALAGGCVAPSAPAGDFEAMQEGWPEFAERLYWGTEDGRVRENARDWQEALIVFENVSELRAYHANGWWDEFVQVVLRDADRRGDIMARRDTEDYDELVDASLR